MKSFVLNCGSYYCKIWVKSRYAKTPLCLFQFSSFLILVFFPLLYNIMPLFTVLFLRSCAYIVQCGSVARTICRELNILLIALSAQLAVLRLISLPLQLRQSLLYFKAKGRKVFFYRCFSCSTIFDSIINVVSIHNFHECFLRHLSAKI